jgi:hypothetical protein
MLQRIDGAIARSISLCVRTFDDRMSLAQRVIWLDESNVAQNASMDRLLLEVARQDVDRESACRELFVHRAFDLYERSRGTIFVREHELKKCSLLIDLLRPNRKSERCCGEQQERNRGPRLHQTLLTLHSRCTQSGICRRRWRQSGMNRVGSCVTRVDRVLPMNTRGVGDTDNRTKRKYNATPREGLMELRSRCSLLS